ncbi:MAG: o-succinylbenzoate synthase [Acidimicrobiales bacterium]|nr:o-succinylbenzoate synthase [Acidimicrobiales bacterium]
MSRSEAPLRVTLWRVRLPLLRALSSGHGTENLRDFVLVEVEAQDGATGWGECSALARPTYTSEHVAGAWALLRDELAPAWLEGRESGVVGHPMASAAIGAATRDLSLRRRGRALVDHVAVSLGRPRPTVPVCCVVGRGPVDQVVSEVAGAVGSGAVLVKIKVTPRPTDIEAVREVRRCWPRLDIAVDGNGTLDTRSVRALADLRLAYIEQPAPADDLIGSAALARVAEGPVALDESVTSVASLHTAAALGAGHLVNVKPARLGGTDDAVSVVLAAEDLGWGCFVGGMLESGIGRAAALAVAASERCALPTDLGPSDRYFAADIAGPVVADDHGHVVVPVGVGSGVEVDRERLESAACDRLVLEAP